MLLQFKLEVPQLCIIFCFTLTLLVELLRGMECIGQLFQHNSKPTRIVACAQSRSKTVTKTYNKEMCQAL